MGWSRRLIGTVAVVVSLIAPTVAVAPAQATTTSTTTTATAIPALTWYPGSCCPTGAGNNAHEYWLVFADTGYGRVIFVARPASGTLGHIDWPIPRAPEPKNVGTGRITFRAEHMPAQDRRGFLSSLVYFDATTFLALAQARAPIRNIGYWRIHAPGAASAIHDNFVGSIADEVGFHATFGPELGVTIYGPASESMYDCTQPDAHDRVLIGVWAATGATRVAIIVDGHVIARGKPGHDARVPGLALFSAVVSHASRVGEITVRSDAGTYSEFLPACLDA